MQGATARLLWLACLCLSLTAGEAGYARYSQHRRRTLRRTFRLQSSLPGSTSMSGLVQQSEVARQKQLADPATAYVAACLAVRDQHADIREWLDYHQRIGVGRFIIYDNNSTQGSMLPLFADLAEAGVVAYHELQETASDTRPPQLQIYDLCLQKYGANHTWMLFTDADEFVVVKQGGTLPVLLHAYEEHAALVLNWQIFGTSGWQDRPPANLSTLAAYTSCLPREHVENLHVKSVVQPARTLHASTDPHHFIYAAPFYAVNEAGERSDGPRSTSVHIDKVALHHYVTKSRAEFEAKMARGCGMGGGKTIHYLRLIEQESTEQCLDAAHL